MQFTRFLFCFLLPLATALAQTARWDSAGTGDPADLQLIFEGCAPDGDPRTPTLSDGTLTLTGTSEQTSIVNFTVNRSVILSYRLRARAAGKTEIPAFKVKTNKGEILVPAYTTGAVQPGPEADIHPTLKPASDTVWAGQVFPLTYTLDVARRNFSNFGGNVTWDSSPLLAEDWSKPEIQELQRRGESRLIVNFRTRASAKTAGTYKLKPATQVVNLVVGTVGFGLFQQQRIDQVTLSTDQPEINVQPLPLPAPASFTGAVGQFHLTSKVVPMTAAVGEPITWTLELTGTGNWPDINGLPVREVSKDFQIVQPQPKRTVAEGKLFDGTLAQDVVLVPTKTGSYTLGSVEFTYFDPASGTYQTVHTPAATVTITPESAPRFNVTPQPTEPAAAPTPPAVTAPVPPVNPTGLPRDPVPGASPVATPFAAESSLWLAALLPFAGLLLCWLTMAARRARQTDPLLPRRAARLRLAATLNRFATASADERPTLLLAWQHDAAQLWPLAHAAPPARALANPEWETLWNEAERALYSPKAELPSDWLPRAQAALAARKVPGFSWSRTFLPANLLPFFCVLLLLATSPILHATEPDAAYRAGDFAQAEAGWRDVVKKAPTDWIARHNLALALAQQDRWQEAAAQATAAFVQNPRDDSAQWNLTLACAKAGYTPTAIAPLLERNPLPDLARQASPATWEQSLIGAAVLATAALAWLLVIAYGLVPRWNKWPAWSVFALALIVAGAAVAGRSAYGIAADPRSAVVWRPGTLYSIPTEADTAQQTTTLPSGSVGVIDKTFLTWDRLVFPNGQTGWVRQSEVVPLWR